MCPVASPSALGAVQRMNKAGTPRAGAAGRAAAPPRSRAAGVGSAVTTDEDCDSRAGLPLRYAAGAGRVARSRPEAVDTRIRANTKQRGSRVPVRPQRRRAAPGGRATDTTLAWTTRDGYVARERRASH